MKVGEADLQDILKAYGRKTRPPNARRNSKKKGLSAKTIRPGDHKKRPGRERQNRSPKERCIDRLLRVIGIEIASF